MEIGRLEVYEPDNFASNFLSRIPCGRSRDVPLFRVFPRLNSHLFDQVAAVFEIVLYIFTCDSKGGSRALLSMHGMRYKNTICLCFVADTQDFSNPNFLLEYKRRVTLSRESKAVISKALEKFANLLSLSGAKKKEKENLLIPPLQYWPMSPEAERWILIQDADSFFKIFVCRRGCQAVLATRRNRTRHETFDCPSDTENFNFHRKVKYTTKPFRPRERIQDLFFGIGYNFTAAELSPNGFVTFDLESSQRNVTETGRTGRTEILSVHQLFSLGFSWSLDTGSIESLVLYRVHYENEYAMISAWVEKLIELAKRNAELEKIRKQDVWSKLVADDTVLSAEAADGFHQRRLRRLMNNLRVRLSTIVILGWNTSRFDLPLLIGSGLLAALKEHCSKVRVLKRSSNCYLLVEASDSEYTFTLRFVDALLFSSPCSLKSFLESHRQTGDEDLDGKGIIPYGNIQRAFNEQGEDSGEQFLYEDFKDSLLGGANSLDFPHEQYLKALSEWGETSLALRALGLREAPLPGPQVYAQLRNEWERRSLTTALKVLHAYQLGDTEPLLRVCLRRHAFVLNQAGVSSYLDHPSLSSQAFNEMLRSAMHGKNPMTLYPLGPFLTRLFRSQVCGGASWVNTRRIQVGDSIPPQRINADKEDGLLSTQMERVHKIITIDCNALYAKAMTKVYTGLPVLRLATNCFGGSLLARGKRHNFVYEWLSWCEMVEEHGVEDIRSEFKQGESFVLIERSKYAAQIDAIWDETIGVYLEEERQRGVLDAQNSIADVNTESDEGEDSSRSGSEDIESRKSLSSLLEAFEEIMSSDSENDSVDEEELLSTREPLPDLASSPEGSEQDEEVGPPPFPYFNAAGTFPAMQRAAATRKVENGAVSPPLQPPPADNQQGRDPRPASARFRFSKNRKTLRFRVDGLGHKKDNKFKFVVFEFDKCGANHKCPHTECPFNINPRLADRMKLVDRSLREQEAEDRFRHRCILLKYEICRMWECDWSKMRTTLNHPVKDFVQTLRPTVSPYSLDQEFTENEILDEIKKGKMQGFCYADVEIPPDRRIESAELPPLFHNRSLTYNDLSYPMRDYARFLGKMESPTKTLVMEHSAYGILLSTDYYLYLMSEYGAIVSNVRLILEMEPTDKLSDFVESNLQMRREADANNDPVMASTAKGRSNSAYGMALYRRDRSLTTTIIQEKDWLRHLKRGGFASAVPVGKPGEEESLLEISKVPQCYTETSPVILGFAILNQSKLILLKMERWLRRMLRPTSWSLVGGDDIRSCVREDALEEFDREKELYLVDPLKPETKRQPGLFKVEASGDRMIFLSAKLYRLSDKSGDVKLATRGISKTRTSFEDVSFAAFNTALERPKHFADKLHVLGVRVHGPGKLEWKDGRPRDVLLQDLEEQVTQWLFQPDLRGPLFVQNGQIRSYRNELRTVQTSKLFYSGLYAKRLTLPDLVHTVPLSN